MADLPAAGLQQLAFGNLGDVEAGHGFAERAAGFEQFAGIIEIPGGLHDGFGARGGVGGFEDAGADEDGLGAELHDERGVGGSGDATGGEVGHGQLAVLCHPFDQLKRRGQGLGVLVEFFLAEHGELLHLFDDGADVADGFDDVAGAGFALSADHGGAFADAAEGFAEVARATDEGSLKAGLIDVVLFVGGGEDFALIDEIDAQRFENAGLHEVADAGFGHHRDGGGFHDLFDDGDVGHAGHAAIAADIGGDAFESHDGGGAGIFGDLGLLGVGDVHDDAALQHFGEADVDPELFAGKLKHTILLKVYSVQTMADEGPAPAEAR